MTRTPPRLFGILAARAPIVAVIRRGPTGWCHVGRWDVGRDRYEPGSWIRAHLYPQRCDLSPDGRWLCYFTLKASARWKAGGTYIAISRLPWLTALAAWGTCGTWTRGAHFLEHHRTWTLGEPDEGDAAPCRKVFGLALTRSDAFAVERRRGWSETPDTPPRDVERDLFDTERGHHVTMEKPRPGSGPRLRVRGWYAGFRESPTYSRALRYELIVDGRRRHLDDVQWADWAPDGRLLVATTAGRLQARDACHEALPVTWETDLGGLTPRTGTPPAEARHW